MHGSMIRRCSLGVLLAFILAGLTGCSSKPDETPPPPWTGGISGLVFAYGVGARNVLDTEAGTFTADMILASPVTVPLRLTDAEMARIARKMEEIDFFSYPEKYVTPERGDSGWVTPYLTYVFRVTTQQGTKVVEWEDQVVNDDSGAANLRELADLIRGMIQAKPAYQTLPEPEGGYL